MWKEGEFIGIGQEGGFLHDVVRGAILNILKEGVIERRVWGTKMDNLQLSTKYLRLTLVCM